MIRSSIMLLTAAVLAITLALMAGSGDVARADPDTVQAGHDLLETDSTTTFLDFSGTPIPADFFGPGSDPFSGSIDLEGAPFDSFGGYDGLTPTDTIVERLQAAEPALPYTIDIEIVRLELVSTTPITVTYDGGQDPEDWDVAVQVPEGDTNQTQGSMDIYHEEFDDGGTFDSTLPVKPTLTFTRDLEVRVLAPPDSPTLTFTATDVPWCHTANPLVSPPGQLVIEKAGLTSNFFPGITCGPPRTKNFFVQVATEAEHGVRPAETEAVVGGIADFPDIGEPEVGTADSSGGPSFPYAALAGGLAAGVAAFATGAWYVRRRWLG